MTNAGPSGAGLPICERLRRVYTMFCGKPHFSNKGAQLRAADLHEAAATIEALYGAAETARGMLEILGDDNMSPDLADALDQLDAALTKARASEQSK